MGGLSADLPDLIPTHDFKEGMGTLWVLQSDGDGIGKPRSGEEGEGEDSRPHKKSLDRSHFFPLRKGNRFEIQ